MVTRERLHELVEELPEQQTEEAARLLEQLKQQPAAERHDEEREELPLRTAAEILAQYGPYTGISPAPPLSNIERFIGKIFPDDESAEEFDATIRRWRTEGERSRLPD